MTYGCEACIDFADKAWGKSGYNADEDNEMYRGGDKVG